MVYIYGMIISQLKGQIKNIIGRHWRNNLERDERVNDSQLILKGCCKNKSLEIILRQKVRGGEKEFSIYCEQQKGSGNLQKQVSLISGF